jgi:phage-related protein
MNLKEKLKARAVVLLDPKYLKGDTSEIAGIKTPDVIISLEELTEYINEFALFTKKFLKNINIDDCSAPRTVYVSTEDRRVYLFHFFVKSKTLTDPFPVYLGITVKKDMVAIENGKENPWEIPQYVFDAAWGSIKEIQGIYSRF